jgi:hypothetical protein
MLALRARSGVKLTRVSLGFTVRIRTERRGAPYGMHANMQNCRTDVREQICDQSIQAAGPLLWCMAEGEDEVEGEDWQNSIG